jgi:ABC-type dipeptide/oligopeptide/nickel transport system permease subunit
MAGLGMLSLILVMAVLGRFITPYDPLEPDMQAILSPPSWKHPMGTDQIGRDMFSRIIAGAPYSLFASIVATLIAIIIGVPLGLMGGYFGGWIGRAFDMFTDALLAFPGILLALAIVTALGPGFTKGMIAVGISFSPVYMRLVRGEVLRLKESLFVESARALGASELSLLFRHILPNILAPLIVVSSMAVGGAILAGAGLSYLGLGAQPPIPEWGALMNAGIWFLSAAPWITLFPGLLIMLTVLALNLLGDGLRDALDPRQYQLLAGKSLAETAENKLGETSS